MKKMAILAVALALTSASAMANGPAIGTPVEKFGMTIGASYRSSMVMFPQSEAGGPVNADLHLQADVHALKGNANGYNAGEWISALGITYELSKAGADFQDKGVLVPVAADDGPHYGRNVKLAGPGIYHLVLHFNPPSTNGFYRHTDKETGVAAWWQPFSQEWNFTVGEAGR